MGKQCNSSPSIKRILFFFRYAKSRNPLINAVSPSYYKLFCLRHHLKISNKAQISGELYIGHFYCNTINSKAILGCNSNIFKGNTSGQENKGKNFH